MADYWVSQGKTWCQYCKIFIQNNKVSKSQHENGQNHQNNVKKFLYDMKKRKANNDRENINIQKEIRNVEKAAMKKMAEDVMSELGEGSQSTISTTSKFPSTPSETSSMIPTEDHSVMDVFNARKLYLRQELEQRNLMNQQLQQQASQQNYSDYYNYYYSNYGYNYSDQYYFPDSASTTPDSQHYGHYESSNSIPKSQEVTSVQNSAEKETFESAQARDHETLKNHQEYIEKKTQDNPPPTHSGPYAPWVPVKRDNDGLSQQEEAEEEESSDSEGGLDRKEDIDAEESNTDSENAEENLNPISEKILEPLKRPLEEKNGVLVRQDSEEDSSESVLVWKKPKTISGKKDQRNFRKKPLV